MDGGFSIDGVRVDPVEVVLKGFGSYLWELDLLSSSLDPVIL